MKKVFLVDVHTADGRTHKALATSQGRLIIATTEAEVAAGPTRDVVDLEEVTVSEWITEATGDQA